MTNLTKLLTIVDDIDSVDMTDARLEEIRGMAETLQWGTDAEAGQAMWDLLALARHLAEELSDSEATVAKTQRKWRKLGDAVDEALGPDRDDDSPLGLAEQLRAAIQRGRSTP